MSRTKQSFTLIELLVVIAIIAILIGIVLPNLSKGRDQGRTLACLNNLRELGAGWQMYADENDNAILPHRMYEKDGGKRNPANWYDVGNGLKYRPRWVATLGTQIGIFAFDQPLTENKDGELADRQDYENEVFRCPAASHLNNERNYGYGYNYQFLGNARQTNYRYHNYPVMRHRIKASSGTVLAADCMGTAAGFAVQDRGAYERLGDSYHSMANHGHTLDPPRLTFESDCGTGDAGSPRTAVDPRHQDKVNAIFADGHGETTKPYDLGYRTNRQGAYVHYDPDEASESGGGGGGVTRSNDEIDPGGKMAQFVNFDPDEDGVIDGSHNRSFSGSGRDDDPPEIPQISGL